MTTGTDTFVGTAKNDTFTATSATLQTADTIIDQSSTDNDTMNITLTTKMLVGTHDAKIAGVENVNVDWNAFGTATIEAGNITGATITGTSSKTGFLGSMDVNGAGANTIVAGSGMIGTLTVADATTSVVDAGAAKSVSVTSANTTDAEDTLTLTAGANTKTVTVSGFDSATINAGTATTISVTDKNATGEGDTASLTFGANATLTNAVDVLTVTASAADLTLTLTPAAAVQTSLDVAGTNNTTIAVADMANITTSKITKSSTGTLTVTSTGAAAAADLSKVAADLFVYESTIGSAQTFASGAEITLKDNAGANSDFFATTGTNDTLTVNVSTNQTELTFDDGATTKGVETVTINVDAEAVNNAADITISAIENDDNKVILTGANDIVVSSVTAKTLDATAYTGELEITQSTTDANMDVNGGTGKNTVVFKSATTDNNFVGQDGNDKVTFATTTGSAVAVLGNGTNEVIATSLTTGNNLVVVAGSGDDKVTVTTTIDQNTTLELGDGKNTVILTLGTKTVAEKDLVTIVTGSGNDTIEITNDTEADDVLNITLGEGTNTLSLSTDGQDISSGTVNISGLDAIAMAGSATVAASLVSGKTISVTAANSSTDTLTVEGTVATGETIDLSSLVIDQSITKAVNSVVINGNAGNDTITGTSIADVIDTVGGTNTVTGGAGADIMTSNGTDTFVIATGDTGSTLATADQIIGFTTAVDKLKLGVAGTDSNYKEGIALAAAADAAANTAFDGTVMYFLASTGGTTAADSALYIDRDLDGTFDEIIELTGVTLATFAATDIIA